MAERNTEEEDLRETIAKHAAKEGPGAMERGTRKGINELRLDSNLALLPLGRRRSKFFEGGRR